MKKKKILLTGSNGQLGSAVKKFFNKKNYNLKTVDRKYLTVYSQKKLINLIDGFSPDIIINTAAIVGLKKTILNKQETEEINQILPKTLTGISRNKNIHLIQISTHSVFDGCINQNGFDESFNAKPLSFYSTTKTNAEDIIISGCKNFTILRLPYIYSSNFEKKTNVLMKIVEDINSGTVNINKKEISSLVHVNSAVKAINDIILNNANGVYHCSDIGTFDWYNLIIYISKLMKLNVKVKDNTISNSISKNTTLLSQKPFFGYNSWKHGVREVIMSLKKSN